MATCYLVRNIYRLLNLIFDFARRWNRLRKAGGKVWGLGASAVGRKQSVDDRCLTYADLAEV